MKQLLVYLWTAFDPTRQRVDLSENFEIVMDKVVTDLNDPLKKTGSYSYTLTFPFTQNNKRVFQNIQHPGRIGKFKASYSCQVVVGSNVLITGEFVHTKITPGGFEGFITARKAANLGDLIGEGTLRDIQSFNNAAIQFRGDATIDAFLKRDLEWKPSYEADANTSEFAFPLVPDSFYKVQSPHYYYSYLLNSVQEAVADRTFYTKNLGTSYEDFPPSFFCGAILENIFEDSGYSLHGSILSDATFRKAMLLYSNQNGEDARYNYGTLNPLRSFHLMDLRTRTGKGVGSTTYTVFPAVCDLDEVDTIPYGDAGSMTVINCFTPYYEVTQGDLSYSTKIHSAENHQGNLVYTPKYTGFYNIDFRFRFRIFSLYNSNYQLWTPQADVPGQQAGSKVFATFREITASEFLENDWENRDQNSDSFYTADGNTLLSQLVRSDIQSYRQATLGGRVYLEKGKQYAFQIYYSTGEAPLYESCVEFVSDEVGNYFNITSCEGPTELHLADFLPGMKKTDFVQAMFKLFNLYYTINSQAKTVTLYTRDEYFSLNASSQINLTDRLSLDQFVESPFTDSDRAATEFAYANDSKDFGLSRLPYNQTRTYLDVVNGEQAEGEKRYTLPFAPLTFYKFQHQGETGGYMIPHVLTQRNYEDKKLNEIAFSNGFEYMPRLALYEGRSFAFDGANNWPFKVRFTRSMLAHNSSDYTYQAAPFVRFFSISKQPYLDVSYGDGFSMFTDPVSLPIFQSIYTTVYPNVGKFYAADGEGLQLPGSKSLFGRLYANSLVLLDLSHYLEGPIKMDDLLFTQLDGRQVIVIGSDKYLLDSISEYRITGSLAQIKLVKLLATT